MLQLRRRAAAAPPRPDILGQAARRRRYNEVGARLDSGQNRQVKSLQVKNLSPPPPRPCRRAPIFWDRRRPAADTMTSAHGSTPNKTLRSKASANQQQTL